MKTKKPAPLCAGFFFAITCLLLLNACASFSSTKRVEIATEIANSGKLHSHTFSSSNFAIASFMRITRENDSANIYIEGDGYSWINRTTLSSDPTPIDPIALRLAAIDKSDNVLYLARPCQYQNLSQSPECSTKVWSSHRYSPAVLDSYHQILDQIKASGKINKLHLIGFSGGGAIVGLLAATRNDIASMRTIGGNMNHSALNRQKRVSSLYGSLDAVDYAHNTSAIPQHHFYGGKDKIVPPWVSRTYLEKVGSPSCAKRFRVQNADHTTGWETFWKVNWNKHPKCP